MEPLIPEPMQLDDDFGGTLEAFRCLTINSRKWKSPTSLKKSYCNQFLTYRRSPLFGRYSQQRQFKRQVDSLEASRSRQKALVSLLCDTLQGQNPLNAFYTNYHAVIADWRKLLVETEIPCNASSSSPHVIRALKVIDSVICGRQTSNLLRRLAHVRLMQLFSNLEDTIKLERESGLVIRGRYYRDASVALDIYMSAQEDPFDPDCLRRKLKERKRAGRSWQDLSKPSPLFVLMYSDATERIV